MIKQLCIRKIVRSRNVWVLIDCSDPGLENLLTVGEHKVTKTGDCSDLRLPLTVPSDERDPPNLISEVNTFAALGERIIAKKIQNGKMGSCVCKVAVMARTLNVPRSCHRLFVAAGSKTADVILRR
jgi:hypothetical protein